MLLQFAIYFDFWKGQHLGVIILRKLIFYPSCHPTNSVKALKELKA